MISGTGTFVSGWRYNSANLPTSMTYPGGNSGQSGEMLTYTYNTQMTLKRIYSQSQSYYYLQNSQYDEAGRMTYRGLGAANLGSNPLLNNVYAYFDWDEQGGRLDWFKTYTSTVNNLLQHLAYDYDNLGNIENLYDYMSGSPQIQSFTCDPRNRLNSAQATGGTHRVRLGFFPGKVIRSAAGQFFLIFS